MNALASTSDNAKLAIRSTATMISVFYSPPIDPKASKSGLKAA